jgi:hypothetical protein
MAGTKISALPAATTLAGTEVVPVVQGGSSKKATITQLLAGVNLDAYAPLASPTFTGSVTIPTAGAGSNTTIAASTAWVRTYVTGLGYTSNTGTVESVTATAPIVSSGGATPVISISAASTDAAGSMSASDKAKLDGVAAGAQVNVATDLSYTASTRLLESSTGTDVTLPLVSSSNAGLAPASGGGTSNFLRADGTWATAGSPPGGSSGQLQWNSSSAFAGVTGSSVDGSGNITLAARFISSLNGAASAPPASITGTWFTGGTATTTKPQVLIEPSGTTSTAWSTSGTGLGVNAGSGFAGNLLDLQVNGTNRARISSTGELSLGTNGGLRFNGNNLEYTIFSIPWITFSSGNVNLFSTGSFSIGGDTFIFRDAANIYAQRNGTAAQTFRLYNTYTDASNYERLATTWSSNVAYIKPENAGTGSARIFCPVTGGTTVAGLPAASTAGVGARAFVTDASATTFLSTVAGGGANKVPVVSDGTKWLIG